MLRKQLNIWNNLFSRVQKLPEENRSWVSVVALANTGFGFTLFLDGFIYTGLVPEAQALGMLVFSLIFMIGLGYFIAGVIELRLGMHNTGYVVMAYSVFGFVIGSIYLFSYGLKLFYPPSPTVMLAFWIFWIFVSALSGVILRPLGRIVSINLYWLAVTFALFAAAGYGNPVVELVTGIVAFAQGILNWYIVAGVVVNTTYGKMLVPMR